MSEGVFTLTEEQELAFTQSIRKNLVHELVQVNPTEKVTNDKDRTNLLLIALRDMDKSNLSKANTRVKNKTADGIQNIGDAMAEILTATPGYASISGVRTTPVEVPRDELLIDLVEDETSVGVKTFTYEEMIAE